MQAMLRCTRRETQNGCGALRQVSRRHPYSHLWACDMADAHGGFCALTAHVQLSSFPVPTALAPPRVRREEG